MFVAGGAARNDTPWSPWYADARRISVHTEVLATVSVPSDVPGTSYATSPRSKASWTASLHNGESAMIARPGPSVEQFEELARRYSSLPQDGTQSASLDGAVLGDYHGPAIGMPVDGVAAFRAHVDEAQRLDNTGDLADR